MDYVVSPRLIKILKKKPTLVHMAFFSIGIPLAAAIGTLIHSARGPINLKTISASEPFPHWEGKQQKFYQYPEHNHAINHPVFDRDYNYLGHVKN